MATDLQRVVKGMVRAAKTRSTKAKVPFNLTPADITIPFECPVLGIPIIVGADKASDNSPSLDRVVPALGYVRGNVLVISNRANRIKNNATIAELRQVAEFFENHMSKHWMIR
ncbi:MAG: hypothetical protein AAFX41_16875 [Bacteroidota bacterium]